MIAAYLQIPTLILLLAVFLWNAKGVYWNDKYNDKSTTSIINGLFVCLVFIHHFGKRTGGEVVNYVGEYMGQLVVVTFLFYSGYGCMVQLRKRGYSYLASFPRRRILPFVMNYWVFAAVYAVLAFAVGRRFSFSQLLLSFTSWTGVGYNIVAGGGYWYVFAIVFLFIMFYLALKMVYLCNLWGGGGRLIENCFPKLSGLITGVIIIGVSIIIMAFALHGHKHPLWYNTMLVFLFGVIYGAFYEKIGGFLRSNLWAYLVVTIACVLVVIASERLPFSVISFSIKAIAFAFAVVLISMKIQLQSPFLQWCGAHVTPIYFYQQLSLNAIATIDFGLDGLWRWWFYFIACGFITLMIAALYPRFQVKPDSRMLKWLTPIDNFF